MSEKVLRHLPSRQPSQAANHLHITANSPGRNGLFFPSWKINLAHRKSWRRPLLPSRDDNADGQRKDPKHKWGKIECTYSGRMMAGEKKKGRETRASTLAAGKSLTRDMSFRISARPHELNQAKLRAIRGTDTWEHRTMTQHFGWREIKNKVLLSLCFLANRWRAWSYHAALPVWFV